MNSLLDLYVYFERSEHELVLKCNSARDQACILRHESPELQCGELCPTPDLIFYFLFVVCLFFYCHQGIGVAHDSSTNPLMLLATIFFIFLSFVLSLLFSGIGQREIEKVRGETEKKRPQHH